MRTQDTVENFEILRSIISRWRKMNLIRIIKRMKHSKYHLFLMLVSQKWISESYLLVILGDCLWYKMFVSYILMKTHLGISNAWSIPKRQGWILCFLTSNTTGACRSLVIPGTTTWLYSLLNISSLSLKILEIQEFEIRKN